MSILDFFRIQKRQSASIAKERLQIIIAHERNGEKQPKYLPLLKQEIIDVIAKYVNIDQEQVKVKLENSGDYSVLELNITLPETVLQKAS
ncbi:cell division topological specificity factor MinE [soil metagenome]